MTNKKTAYQRLAHTILEKCKLRGMEGFYCETSEEALSLIKELVPEGSKVSCGGSETLHQTGIYDYLINEKFLLYDRENASAQEKEEMYAKEVCSDFYFMSTNAITFDGELVNIDGNGNRLACLMCGPKNVIIVAGMNKAAATQEEAISRVKNMASPPNAIRLNKDTPCSKFGKCVDCLTNDCICCHTVITRKSRIKNRIKVILIGEELGF